MFFGICIYEGLDLRIFVICGVFKICGGLSFYDRLMFVCSYKMCCKICFIYCVLV